MRHLCEPTNVAWLTIGIELRVDVYGATICGIFYDIFLHIQELHTDTSYYMGKYQPYQVARGEEKNNQKKMLEKNLFI